MDLKDLIDLECGLQQDEWSYQALLFGDKEQLRVVGWSGRINNIRYYILKCSVCSQDPELFGEGYFRTTKARLINLKQTPCGCSKSHLWNKDQYYIRCKRKSIELGYKFCGFVGNWKNSSTRIKMLCEKHGEWDRVTINSLLSGTVGCSKCRIESRLKPDNIMIASFFDSGAFHPNTKFWRSDRVSNKGQKKYWWMLCPECGQSGEGEIGNFQRGSRCCQCSSQRQTESYINLIKDHDNIIAIKFGIANNASIRLQSQNSLCIFDIELYLIYKFPDYKSCKEAERQCKSELECGILQKSDMKDGYTETTWPYNIDKIIRIYERNGGVKLNSDERY